MSRSLEHLSQTTLSEAEASDVKALKAAEASDEVLRWSRTTLSPDWSV